MTQSQAILSVHLVRVELQLHRLPKKSLHIARYSREDPGVLKFNDMVMVMVYVLPPPFCLDVCRWCSVILVSTDHQSVRYRPDHTHSVCCKPP